jgi:hypothetical protein
LPKLGPHPEIDDASGTDIAALERYAHELIGRESGYLDPIARALSG